MERDRASRYIGQDVIINGGEYHLKVGKFLGFIDPFTNKTTTTLPVIQINRPYRVEIKSWITVNGIQKPHTFEMPITDFVAPIKRRVGVISAFVFGNMCKGKVV